MARVYFISTVNGRSQKKKEKKPIMSCASSRHINKTWAIYFCASISMKWTFKKELKGGRGAGGGGKEKFVAECKSKLRGRKENAVLASTSYQVSPKDDKTMQIKYNWFNFGTFCLKTRHTSNCSVNGTARFERCWNIKITFYLETSVG